MNKLKLALKSKAFNYSQNFIEKVEGARLAYSQEGEDLLLSKLFGIKRNGFFVDVGAHHPKLYSNTYFFYKLGWRGINIDPLPGIMEEFNKHRPEDINLELAISDKAGTLTYHLFNEPALNTFSKELAEERVKKSHGVLASTKDIQVIRLEDVLAKYLKPETKIDFLSVDVEGLDYQVLMSNNWEKFRPQVVIVECLGASIESIMQSDVCRFMQEKDYLFFSKTVGSTFFIDKKSDYKKLF